ncbi:hypothetical protein REPUB_Repub14bG0064000 [Reevesia pubescens]
MKLFQQQHKGKDFASKSSGAGAAASYTMGQPPPPPPQPPKESFARRYKFLWPLLLAVNFTVGAYLFMRTKKKDTSITEEDVAIARDVGSTPVITTVTAPPVTEKPLPAPSITQPVKLPEPIPESQQRELFKHILEEKRKVKPKDPEEKKRLDEEKAILKQFVRAKYIPKI